MNTIDDTKKEKKNGETKEKMKTRRWAAVERWSWVVTMVGLLLTVAALAFGYVQLSEARKCP